MYTRKCPDCNKDLTYKWQCQLKVAVERNSVCKSCRTARANRSPKRKNTLNCNPAWGGYEEIPRAWFTKYFLRGRRKHKDGTITMEEVWQVYINQDKKCALSGVPIDFKSTPQGVSASIDRIDSNIGYHLNNIQLVHKNVNLMKNHFNQQYFIEMCKKITENKGS